jgi:hypothetical protein
VLLSTVAGFMSCDAAAGHTSPGGTTLGKRGRQGACKQDPPKAPQSACYASGVPIRPDTVSDSSSGRKVLVYWPADQQWWEATLCWVSREGRALQGGWGVFISRRYILVLHAGASCVFGCAGHA